MGVAGARSGGALWVWLMVASCWTIVSFCYMNLACLENNRNPELQNLQFIIVPCNTIVITDMITSGLVFQGVPGCSMGVPTLF